MSFVQYNSPGKAISSFRYGPAATIQLDYPPLTVDSSSISPR